VLHTGQFIFDLPLLSISSVGGKSWSFNLKYLPGAGTNGLLGRNWDYTQNACLIDVGGGNVELLSGNQTRELFMSNGDGTFSSLYNNTMATLVLTGTGVDERYELTTSDGTVSVFYGHDVAIQTPGKIITAIDRYGNVQSFD